MTKRYSWVPMALMFAVAGCTITLVSPYNSELEQKASAMEAEVSTWELAMREGAGTLADDPRDPQSAKVLDKWRGEADAMLTLIVSSDPGTVSCSQVAALAYRTLESHIPDDLRSKAAAPAGANSGSIAGSSCEAGLVADLKVGIDDIARVLQYCQLPWVPETYFDGLRLGRTPGPAPSEPQDGSPDKIKRSCLAEFKEEPASSGSAGPGTTHGRAVSHLVTTLQVIIYVENRKKAAEAK